MSRTISQHYSDPLDLIWIEAARVVGLRVERSSETYASTDGLGTLYLSNVEAMDADDCLAQMILHEICHFMVQGPKSLGWVDWGLDNEGAVDVEREHACLRLQAALLDPFGLRQVLAPTTDFRAYYDQLSQDPFQLRQASDQESIVRAKAAYHRRQQLPFRDALTRALEATASIARVTSAATAPLHQPEHLLCQVVEPPARHQVGLPTYPDTQLSCDSCAWIYKSGKSGRYRCRQAGKPTTLETSACSHYEPTFDCLSCGACCREAYDTVEVARTDPATKLHLSLMIQRTDGYDMKRDGSRCVCLRGGIDLPPPKQTILGRNIGENSSELPLPSTLPGGDPFTCQIYESRPKTCRDFTIFSEHCLHARRRVGLSR